MFWPSLSAAVRRKSRGDWRVHVTLKGLALSKPLHLKAQYSEFG